jgi:hypothetical protein
VFQSFPSLLRDIQRQKKPFSAARPSIGARFVYHSCISFFDSVETTNTRFSGLSESALRVSTTSEVG